MSFNLFNKKITPSCSYCETGKISPDEENIMCDKKGLVNFSDSCKHFKYDPLKRVPRRKPAPLNFEAGEFQL